MATSISKVLAFLLGTIAILLRHGGSCTAFITAKPIVSLHSRPSSSTTIPFPTIPGSTTACHPHSMTSLTNRGGSSSFEYDTIDWTALVKYSIGLTGQLSLLFGFFSGIDKILAHYPSIQIPFVVNVIFLYLFNLKSSLFSILPNSKNERRKLNQENWEYNKRKVASWTPPGIAFVFGWPLLTFGLRAVTAAMVVEASGGRYASRAIMSLMLHLSIGNLWNTVNNVEDRLGVSVVLINVLWLTKAFAALQFYNVKPLAGKLLALTLTWITAAVVLLTRTWQINPDPDTGKREPLVPMQHPKWDTKFRWER